MYTVNEMFHSLQGEGVRAGTANVFVRFTGCNLRCRMEPGKKSPGGFDCDTEFESGYRLTAEQIHERAVLLQKRQPNDSWMVLTGGEPGLQVDRVLIDCLRDKSWKLAIETNGSVSLPDGLDWITVSPKVAEHAVRQLRADEVKYVRSAGQAVPKTVVQADHYLLSPAFCGQDVDEAALTWCLRLVKENPPWRLSVQSHKRWRIP